MVIAFCGDKGLRECSLMGFCIFGVPEDTMLAKTKNQWWGRIETGIRELILLKDLAQIVPTCTEAKTVPFLSRKKFYSYE